MKITADALSALPGIRHGFYTRAGGVSDGIYASLNCGVGSADERLNVLENRARVTADLGVAPDRLATPYQVHSPDVVVVDEVWAPGAGPKADAVVTARPGIAIGIGTADCGPILFADAEARVIGAAHSGWKGAFTGVLEATVAAMEGLGARRERIVAVLGPTISAAAYEVGPEFHARFVAADPANARFFVRSERPEHHRFDLPAYIGMRLRAARLGTVDDLALCTYADPARFFSYRRTTHAAEPDYGRLLHAIALAK
ncbi:peptidoglycan editing factor PgeF [Kaistia dalseonensis]|uniref:Purine nucleoside phosphorylase n=1 Tax=Kaistia dalseonensis TaxID=410840 RepID=A0ABU0H8H4_9HYPH|nr:peptidoglycan editing factor PgeF [Kaistia dalseonensis]MCX5495186.1 peptidoglycan editing factor PgeF [Kaistia dalseonensis]MDQ0437771.1 YfiH family protein [Kaistia dalseonensis]